MSPARNTACTASRRGSIARNRSAWTCQQGCDRRPAVVNGLKRLLLHRRPLAPQHRPSSQMRAILWPPDVSILCTAQPVSDSARGATSPPLLLLFGKPFPTLRAAFPGRDPPHSFGNKVDGRVRRSLITKDRIHHFLLRPCWLFQHRSRSSSAISTTLTLAYGLQGVRSSSKWIFRRRLRPLSENSNPRISGAP